MFLYDHIKKNRYYKAFVRNARCFWRGTRKNFDKAFYNSRGKQLKWLFGITGSLFLIFLVIEYQFEEGNFLDTLQLFIDPGAFGRSENGFKLLLDLMVTICGSMIFTSILINTIGNMLDRRIEHYKNGEIFYDFDDHILILGANSMLLNIIRALLEDKGNRKRDIAILTDGNVEELRSLIKSEIPRKQADNIYVMYGSRVREEILREIDADETKSIYILGEDNEPTHDALNLECYAILSKVCRKAKNTIKCYMVLERAATLQHFYLKEGNDSTEKLHLTLINSLENTAQRLFVSREYIKDKPYPALDRDGIGEDSSNHVHLIIVGMSQMAYFVATTAAHLCHFPNFDKKGIRTKITFIQEDIEKEMDFFVTRYQNLMDLSYRHYICPEDELKSREYFPDKKFLTPTEDEKGFLDVEWEFIDAGIESEYVRDYIENIVGGENADYTTFAFCNSKPDVNVAASQNLPKSVYCRDIPVFVYQPGGGNVIYSASMTNIFRNLYPFGVKTDCYDRQYQKRILRARRIKYLYDLQNNGEEFKYMPSDSELVSNWFAKDYAYILQQSNLYSANSIDFKLRSIANDNGRRLTEHEVEILSVTEHNRWNIERLLLGFSAYPTEERLRIKEIQGGPDCDEKTELNKKVKKNKKIWFIHKDIAPYNELTDDSKEYDKVIVRNVTEVIK